MKVPARSEKSVVSEAEKAARTRRERKTRTYNLNQKLRAGIINELRSITTAQLHKLMDGLLINAPDSLFEYMCTIQDQVQLTRHFNVMRSLKRCHKHLMAEFDEQMSRGWKALMLGQSIPSLRSMSGQPAEMMIHLSRMADDRFGPLLKILEIHMGGMIDAENVFHPLYPDYLYLSFWHGTGKLGLNHAERLIIVPLFSRYVTDRLGIILADANDMLLSRVEYENV